MNDTIRTPWDDDETASLSGAAEANRRRGTDEPRVRERDGEGIGTPTRPRSRRPAEEMVYRGHPDWRGMFGYYVKWNGVAISAILAGYVLHVLGLVQIAGLVMLSLALLGAVQGIGLLIQRSTVYEVTTRRVTKRWGVVYKHQEEAPLQRIQNVTVKVSFWGRIFKVGSIDFDTAANEANNNVLQFWGVRRPFQVHQGIMRNDVVHDELY